MTFDSSASLVDAVGRLLGPGKWLDVSHERIVQFAEATGDLQWIHVDRERAARGPFGATVAHGFLLLSLLPALTEDYFDLTRAEMAVNYGLNRVRFITPVPSGSRVRAHSVVSKVDPEAGGATQVTLTHTIELEASPKPACVAEMIFRVHF